MLAAMLFVRLDERPSLGALDAFDATALLVTRFYGLALLMVSGAVVVHTR